LKTKLDVIKGAHYSVPANSLKDLEKDPDVAYISPNRPLSGTATSTLDYTPEAVNAPAAWRQWGLDGTGIGVAVIDSGVSAGGDPDGDQPEIDLQHSSDQPFAWPPGIRELYGRSALSGRRGCVECRHRGARRRGPPGPQRQRRHGRLRHHRRSRQRPVRHHSGRDEDGKYTDAHR